MDASFFIARRLRFKGNIAMVSIAVSFLVMILAVAVSSGFRAEIRLGLSAVSGDVQLVPPAMNFMDENSPIESDAAYLAHVGRLRDIEHLVPVAYRVGIVKNAEDIHGVLFKGVSQEQLPLYGIQFPDSVSFPVSVPSRLAEISGIRAGDRMLAYFVGDNVKMRQFNVVAVHESLVETDDKMVVYADLADVQRINGWDKNQLSAVEILLRDKDEAAINEVCGAIGTVANAYLSEDDSPVIALSLVSRYPQLFDWLNLIDFNVAFILLLMTIVAGFNMISGLLIMLFENISTIGLLKSLGMTDRAISKMFLASSAVHVFKGMLWGNLLAVLFCLIQDSTHLLKLNPENYFVSFVPLELDFGLILSADFAAFAAIMLILLLPCLFIAKVDPAETVRMK